MKNWSDRLTPHAVGVRAAGVTTGPNSKAPLLHTQTLDALYPGINVAFRAVVISRKAPFRRPEPTVQRPLWKPEKIDADAQLVIRPAESRFVVSVRQFF
jgi:hypothetical protein